MYGIRKSALILVGLLAATGMLACSSGNGGPSGDADTETDLPVDTTDTSPDPSPDPVGDPIPETTEPEPDTETDTPSDTAGDVTGDVTGDTTGDVTGDAADAVDEDVATLLPPDLELHGAVTLVSPPAGRNYPRGSTIQLSYTMENTGEQDAGMFVTSTYLIYSSGTVSGVEIGSETITSLAGGSTLASSPSYTIPTTASLGPAAVEVRVDSGNSVFESDETNNNGSVASGITITSP